MQTRRRPRSWNHLFLGLIFPLTFACGPLDLAQQHADESLDAAVTADAPAEADSAGDPNCGEQTFTLERGLPPDLVIALDRSGSMTLTSGIQTRWDQVVGALGQTLTAVQDRIRLGLDLFPTDLACGTQNVGVGVALNNATALSNAISSHPPDPEGAGFTPTTNAIYDSGMYLMNLSEPNPKFILLATDGEPNCGKGPCRCPEGTYNDGDNCCAASVGIGGVYCSSCPDPTLAIAAIEATAAAGIHTFVIGIATEGTEADYVLNQMALAGKRPRTGNVRYYAVSSQAELTSAITGIAGRVIACEFQLKTMPVHVDFVSVYADRTLVPRDPTHANGWDYGAQNRSVAFYGDSCQMLQAGTLHGLRIVYSCPPVL